MADKTGYAGLREKRGLTDQEGLYEAHEHGIFGDGGLPAGRMHKRQPMVA
jgi:hypothetical protein